MNEHEICTMFREAKNKNQQIQILAELNGTKQIEIIKVLLTNGEELPERAVDKIYRRLDTLEAQIEEREREYKEIVHVITRGSRRKSGNGRLDAGKFV